MKRKALIIAISGLLSTTAFAQDDVTPVMPEAYQEIYNLNQNTVESKYMDGIKATESDQLRMKSMNETAITLGMQAGVRYRYDQINKEMENSALTLDETFNFKPLLLNNNMLLPPVIDHVEGALTLENNDLINQSDVTYMIRKDARLITAPPSWRDYLIQHFSVVETVNKVMLPKTSEETAAWESAIKQGWEKGVKQAEHVFETNLSRLKRDYIGISTFHSLLRQNIVAMPMVAVGDMGVTINGHKMDVGQKIFRITNHSTFNPAKGWRAYGASK